MGRNALYPLKGHVGAGRSVISGSFVTKNGAVPTDIRGSGFTIAYVSEGLWTVTLDEAAVRIDSVVFGVAQEVLTKIALIDEDEDKRTTSVIRIRQLESDDLTTPSFSVQDAPGNIISFWIVCKDTSVSDF